MSKVYLQELIVRLKFKIFSVELVIGKLPSLFEDLTLYQTVPVVCGYPKKTPGEH